MKIWILFALLFPLTVHACIWDAETLDHEKSRSHDLAQVILDEQPIPPDETKQLQVRIKELETNRHETDPDWWNNLAGAYLRSGQSQKAVDLLEPVLQKFPDNYGIHANLGTAYHLLGRYADAEKEIARDLEINPNAHFGLEKYHLALLQYLSHDTKYQSRHVYVDEFTAIFLSSYTEVRLMDWKFQDETARDAAWEYTNNPAQTAAYFDALVKYTNDWRPETLPALVYAIDAPLAYRDKWDLADDTNFEAGIIYMAQMNPKEPACFTMLGIGAWKKRDYHLAASAFEKAIALGSPQSELLKIKATGLRDYASHSLRNNPRGPFSIGPIDLLILTAILSLVFYALYAILRDHRQIP